MRNAVLGICLLMNCAIAFAQEAAKQPQTLITEKRKLTATVKLPNGEEVKLHGEAFYQVKERNSDDTLTGKFVFTLSTEARQVLAAKTKQPIAEIPDAAESDNVLTEFEKNTKCPEIHLNILKLTIKLTSDLSAMFERQTLNLKETPQEISTVMCHWAAAMARGRSHAYRIGNRVNKLLKGRPSDNNN